MEFEGRNLRKEVEEFLKVKLEAGEKVRRVSWLGKNTNINNNNNRNRGVLVQMETLEAKRRVMRNRRLLKGSRIYVDDDLTRSEREIHKKLGEQAKKEGEKRVYEINNRWSVLEMGRKERKIRKAKFLNRRKEALAERRLVVWNVAGMGRIQEITDFIGDFDLVVLQETWIEEKDLQRFMRKLDE